MRRATPIILGLLAGGVVFSAAFYVWLVFGADPDKDPLLSF